jgi:hypothetical protein
MRPNRSWSFQTFQKADLMGAVEILVEDGSQLPKTSLGMRAAIEHGQKLGVLNPQDPEQQFEIMRKIGIVELSPSIEASTQNALREQSEFARWVATLPEPMPDPTTGQPMPLVNPAARLAVQPQPVPVPAPEPAPDDAGAAPAGPQVQMVAPPAAQQIELLFPGNPLKVKEWDKHQLHIAKHDIYCQSDEYRELALRYPELDELWTLHRRAHMEAWARAQMEMAMFAAAPMAPQGAGMAMANSNQNAGAVPAASPQGAPR